MTACDLIQEIFTLIFDVLKTQIDLANTQFLLCQFIPEVASLLVDLSVQVLEESKASVSFHNTLVQFLLKRGIDNKS